MPAELGSLIFVFLSFAALILYDLRAFSFSASILELRPNHRLAKLFSILTNCVLLALIFAMGLPMLLSYLIVYLAVLLELCMMFRGQAVLLLFGSGNFLFHLMDVQMIVAALYVLLFDIPTPEEFFRRYPSSAFLTLLLVTALLEVFRRGVDQAALRLLLKNNGQLKKAAQIGPRKTDSASKCSGGRSNGLHWAAMLIYGPKRMSDASAFFCKMDGTSICFACSGSRKIPGWHGVVMLEKTMLNH